MSPALTSATALHIVTGKGGTGKTTVAAALAASLAGEGARVALCEVEGRDDLTHLWGVRPLRRGHETALPHPGSGTVNGLSVEPGRALREYLTETAGLGLAASALERTGIAEVATTLAPGLRDVLLFGKVYEVTRRASKKMADPYDAVVFDAPPTGRLPSFLGASEALGQITGPGRLRQQCTAMMALLRRPETTLHMVSLATELSVTETEEGLAALRAADLPTSTVVLNQTGPEALSTSPDPPPGLSTSSHDGFRRLHSALLTQTEVQRRWRQRLDETGLPLIELPRLGHEATRPDLDVLAAIGRQHEAWPRGAA